MRCRISATVFSQITYVQRCRVLFLVNQWSTFMTLTCGLLLLPPLAYCFMHAMYAYMLAMYTIVCWAIIAPTKRPYCAPLCYRPLAAQPLATLYNMSRVSHDQSAARNNSNSQQLVASTLLRRHWAGNCKWTQETGYEESSWRNHGTVYGCIICMMKSRQVYQLVKVLLSSWSFRTFMKL